MKKEQFRNKWARYVRTHKFSKIAEYLQYQTGIGKPKYQKRLDFIESEYRKKLNAIDIEHAMDSEHSVLSLLIINNIVGNEILNYLQHGADPNFTENLIIKENPPDERREENGWFPLLFALKYRTDPLPIMRELLEFGADVNKFTSGRTTCVLYVVKWFESTKALKMIDFLAANGADLEATDSSKMTPLMNAIMGTSVDIDLIRLLLNLGAKVNTNSGDPEYFTPIELAVYNRNEHLVSILLEYGADANAQIGIPLNRKPLLHEAIRFGVPISMIELLVKNGADFELVDSDGKSAIDVAKEYDRFIVVDKFHEWKQ